MKGSNMRGTSGKDKAGVKTSKVTMPKKTGGMQASKSKGAASYASKKGY